MQTVAQNNFVSAVYIKQTENVVNAKVAVVKAEIDTTLAAVAWKWCSC